MLLPTVSAVEIADYPDFFVDGDKFDAIFVVGEEAPSMDVVSATEISTAVAQYNLTPEIGTARVDSEIVDITKKNAIVIGSPCENRAAAQLLGNPSPCYNDLGGGIGYIMVFQHDDKVQLLITGIDEKDRRAAAKFLADKSLESITTDEHMVPSGSGSTPQFYAQKLKEELERLEAQNQTNTTVIAQPVQETTTVEAPAEPNITEYGEYEPLEDLPEEKGFFARIWAWLTGLFT